MRDEKHEIILGIDESTLNFDDIKALWYRRDALFFNLDFDSEKYPKIFAEHFKRFILKENIALKNFLYSELSNKYRVNKFTDEHNNKKTNVLKTATEAWLTIPVLQYF